ncbi:hypothetical protein FI667_g9551, partial [Globisporangium splendens]
MRPQFLSFYTACRAEAGTEKLSERKSATPTAERSSTLLQGLENAKRTLRQCCVTFHEWKTEHQLLGRCSIEQLAVFHKYQSTVRQWRVVLVVSSSSVLTLLVLTGLDVIALKDYAHKSNNFSKCRPLNAASGLAFPRIIRCKFIHVGCEMPLTGGDMVRELSEGSKPLAHGACNDVRLRGHNEHADGIVNGAAAVVAGNDASSFWHGFLARHDALLLHNGTLDEQLPHFILQLLLAKDKEIEELRCHAPSAQRRTATSDDDNDDVRMLIKEKNEQIDVLLDELEQVRRALDESEARLHMQDLRSQDTADVCVGTPCVVLVDKSVQTHEGADCDTFPVLESDSSADLNALESTLRSIEVQNGDLQRCLEHQMLLSGRPKADPIKDGDVVQDCSAPMRPVLDQARSNEWLGEQSRGATDCPWQTMLQEISKAVPTDVSRDEALEFVILQIQQWVDSNTSLARAFQAQDEHRVENAALEERLVEQQQSNQDHVAKDALLESTRISNTAPHAERLFPFRATLEEPQPFKDQRRHENRSSRHDSQLHIEPQECGAEEIDRDSGAAAVSSDAMTDKENAKLKAELSVARHPKRVSLKKKKSKHEFEKRPATNPEPLESTTALFTSRGKEQVNADLTASIIATLREQVETMSSQLSSREQENLSLLQSLGEIKEKYTETEATRSTLEAQLQVLQAQYDKLAHDKVVEQVTSMDAYVNQVNEKLQKIEQEKLQVQHEKELLIAELNAKNEQNDQAKGKVIAVCEKATETDGTEAPIPESHYQQQREAAATIERLELQVKREQDKYEEAVRSIQSKYHEKLQQLQEERSLVKEQKRELEAKRADLIEWRTRVEREFEEYKAANDDAAAENEARIAYLTACVDECSRLVDSPSQEEVTTRDIHDTLVSLSQNFVFSREGARNNATVLKRRPIEKGVKRTVKAQAALAKQATTSTQGVLDATDDICSRNDPVYELQLCQMQHAKLQEQLRRVLLQNDTLESMRLRFELQVEDLKAEVKERMAKETSLRTKHGALKCELVGLKTHFATLSSRYTHVCEELQLRDDEVKVQRDEMSRVRSALQRKSDLLKQQRSKITGLVQELEDSKRKAEQYVHAEKKATDYKQKSKEQLQVVHDLKRQTEMSRANEYRLTVRLEQEKDQNAAHQVRYKALRAENGKLRAQLITIKRGLLEARGDGLDDKAKKKTTPLSSIISVASLQDEVKTLRKRVMQKHELLLGYKGKSAELEAELPFVRSQLLETTQTNRSLQQDRMQEQENAMAHVAAIQADMEAKVVQRADQLDGLRASVYDSLEVFIRCGDDASQSGQRARPLRHPLYPDDEIDTTVLKMRRWTDLSTRDLDNALFVSKTEAPKQRRCTQQEGASLLRRLESALEESPEDCRTEICHILEFLCAREREFVEMTARSY